MKTASRVSSKWTRAARPLCDTARCHMLIARSRSHRGGAMTQHDDPAAPAGGMSRRHFVGATLAGGALALTKGKLPQLAPGKYTARKIVELYLSRIDELDHRGPMLNEVIELNPDAFEIADALDAERKSKGPRSPLHGIPVLIKDNIATDDKMMTTAGSLALVGAKVPRDSFIAARLRAAGAIILGKTNLSEWANFRASHSTSGWSGRGGQSHNPYALDRTPSGSSSGS